MFLVIASISYDWFGQVKITAKDLSSIEKSKAIIANLTMVPTVGDIYRYQVINNFYACKEILNPHCILQNS